MTSNKMTELMKKKIVDKTEEYAGTHENINQNEPDYNNEKELDKKHSRLCKWYKSIYKRIRLEMIVQSINTSRDIGNNI